MTVTPRMGHRQFLLDAEAADVMKPAICSKCSRAHGGFVPDDAEDIVCFACDNPPPAIFISGACDGERCSMCGDAAAHKVAEEIQYDDLHPMRHGLTAYVCHECFVEISGSAMKLLLSFPSEQQ